MSDDLDDFLNTLNHYDSEVPSKISTRGSPAKPRLPAKTAPSRQKDSSLDDLDSLLQDPDLLPEPTKRVCPRAAPGSSKCPVLYISGSEPGNRGNRPCPNMRCSDCDSAVVVFDAAQWAAEVDYLFLRNNYPDYDRLKGLLRAQQGARAYACQCSCISATQHQTLVSAKPCLKWFCATH